VYAKQNIRNAKEYEGEWKNGLYSGRGRVQYRDGQIHKTYDGEWVVWDTDGFKHSNYFRTGKLVYSNGNTFEGTFRYNPGRMDSFFDHGVFAFAVNSYPPWGGAYNIGTSDYQHYQQIMFDAGDSYEGGWDGDRHRFQGESTYTFFNGEKFKCRWCQGECPEFYVRQAAVRAAPDPASAKARADADAAAVVEALAAAASTVSYPPLLPITVMFSCTRYAGCVLSL
jgi:hypothetical protein